jgi:hypothetical protein
MKQRILTGWTFSRALYLLMGAAIIVQSVMAKEWIGVAFGGYFASMGLFAFGCAGGNCYSGSRDTGADQKSNSVIQDVQFEEIKGK